MAAEDHLSQQQFQSGHCYTYARALINSQPSLKLGVAGNEIPAGHPDGDEDLPVFDYQHFFAHDRVHAFDAYGTHKLPYKGPSGAFNHVELNTDDDYGMAESPSARGMDDAKKVARRMGQIK